ncbi:acetyltransferase [candidate division KSB1 bacterium]
MSNKIILIGAGSQGRVTRDVLIDQKQDFAGFIDDGKKNVVIKGTNVRVFGGIDTVPSLAAENYQFIVTIGNNLTRRKIAENMDLGESYFANAVHPSSVVLNTADIGCGNMIFAQTFIGTCAEIGDHVIVNNGVTVEHDCKIGDFAALGPGCRMGGRVTVDEGAFVSTGVTLKPRVHVGRNAVIGAGAVVVNDIPDNAMAYGCPAKVVRDNITEDIWGKLL